MLYQELIDEVRKLEITCDEIYVYGAGAYGKEVAGILLRSDIEIAGFVVTQRKNNANVMGLPVIEVEEIVEKSGRGFVLGVNNFYSKEIKEFLLERNVNFSRIVDGGKYITQNKNSVKLQNYPVLEINPVIGCSINCKYCPQKLMISRYYEDDRNRQRVMKIEDFEMFLGKVPQNCIINFAGMVEPFLHPQCIKLIEMACDSGRRVFLYTTLEGATDEDVDALLRLPIEYVCLHVADEKNYAHITTSEAYYNRVQRLLDATKENGETFVQGVSAQAKPIERIAEMCKGKYEVLVSLQDRCDQIEGENLAKRETEIVNEKIQCAFCGPEVNNHVVLPDGTVLLCNMDYGLNHVIGNLKENTYDEIHNGEKMQRIRRAMAGDQSIDVLCRKCICATVVKGN